MRLQAWVFGLIGALALAWPVLADAEAPTAKAASDAVVPMAAADASAIDKVEYPGDRWLPVMMDVIKRGPRYLFADSFDKDIAPPPANSSRETRADLDALLAMQERERTSSQIELIRYEDGVLLLDVFTLDKLLDADSHPETKKLLQMVDNEVLYYVAREKVRFKRPRPTQLEPKLTTVVPVPRHAAYPSGHATQSYAAALVLSKVDPARADEYKQRAMDVAHRREIAGLHYPSDGVAGRAFAGKIVDVLLALPEFGAQLEKARKEFSAP